MPPSEIQRLARAHEELIELLSDHYVAKKFESEEILGRLEAIHDELRTQRRTPEDILREADRELIDRIRAERWSHEWERKPEEIEDGVTASGRGLRMVITWRVLLSWGKWAVVGGAPWIVHHIQHWLGW